MRRGPLPLPTAIKAVQGTLRPDRVPVGEPAALAVGRAPAPAWLDADATQIWGSLVKTLRQMRVLGGQDLELLGVLADQLAVYHRCAIFLREQGGVSFVVTDGDGTPKGVSAWPEVKIKAQAAAEIRRLCEHFGLSPASRSRVSAAADAEAVPNPLARFLKRRVSHAVA